MKKLIASVLIAASIFLPTAVKGNEKKGKDGYVFQHAEFVNTNLKIKIVIHPSLQDLRDAGMKVGAISEDISPGSMIKVNSTGAWSLINKTGTCEIHIVDAAKQYLPELAGHELMHCIYGRWHD